MAREIDRDNLSKEDALYLSQRGLLSAEEEKKFGIKPVANGGPEPGLGDNSGDIGTVEDAALLGGGQPPTAEDNEPTDLESMDKDQLKAEAEKRDLPKSGSKGDLIDRIREYDSAEDEEPEEEE